MYLAQLYTTQGNVKAETKPFSTREQAARTLLAEFKLAETCTTVRIYDKNKEPVQHTRKDVGL